MCLVKVLTVVLMFALIGGCLTVRDEEGSKARLLGYYKGGAHDKGGRCDRCH